MKFTHIVISPDTNPSLDVTLSIQDPTVQNPYVIKAIAGFDVDELVPTYNLAGSPLQQVDMKAPKRNPVFRILLNPDFSMGQSYSGLRDNLYRIISASGLSTCSIKFFDSATLMARTAGYLTKFEAPHSSEVPEVQMTFECRDAFLYRNGTLVTTTPQPYYTVEDEISTAPHGFWFEGSFSADVVPFSSSTKYSFYSPAYPNYFTFEFSPFYWVDSLGVENWGFLAGDAIRLDSRPDFREFVLIRSGVTYPMADHIVANSVWPQIYYGSNQVRCSIPEFGFTKIFHDYAFWGI